MIINDSLILTNEYKTQWLVNVETGALVVSLTTDGHATSDLTITESSTIDTPPNSVLTFALNGDTATITRV